MTDFVTHKFLERFITFEANNAIWPIQSGSRIHFTLSKNLNQGAIGKHNSFSHFSILSHPFKKIKSSILFILGLENPFLYLANGKFIKWNPKLPLNAKSVKNRPFEPASFVYQNKMETIFHVSSKLTFLEYLWCSNFPI